MNKITKIIELLIDFDDLEMDDTGVELMSLVETPAIGVSWQAFAKQVFEEADDIEMVDGIIELLNKVEDIDNRKIMAQDVIEDFERDNIDYDKERFLEMIGMGSTIMRMIESEEFGESFDSDKTVFVDFTEEKFLSITDVVSGILGLNIASNPTASSETKYMYAGPSSSRPFCSALLRLNKVYTEEELNQMGASVGNGIDRGEDAVKKWHGGPNCRHFFNKVSVTKESTGRTVISNLGRDSRYGVAMADRSIQGYKSQATRKESLKWWWANNNFSQVDMKFQTDDDLMIITGPAMKAFQMIPRKDEDGNMYHVYFSDDTIKKISEKFLRDNAHATDINHSMIATEENTLLESWLVTDPEMDKSKALGFTPSKGDWYVSYKINNQDTWDQIKAGKLNGYSIAGSFIEDAKKS